MNPPKLRVILLNFAFLFLLSSMLFLPVTALRIIFGLPCLLFIPGYVILLALLSTERSLATGEKIALSFALSIAIVAFLGLLLGYTPWGINPYSVVISLWLLSFIFSMAYMARIRHQAQKENFHTFDSNKPVRLNRLIKSPAFWLALIAVLGYLLAFIPHFDYAYPLHVDEWMHMSYSRAIQEAGSTAVATVPVYEFPDFSTGKLVLQPGDVEPAFHVFWAILQPVTNISWLTIFRYFPGLIFILTILSVYILAQRKGYGLEAAFFTALLTSNTTMLGVTFLVPVALGLMFLPLSLFLIFYYRNVPSYIVLAIFIGFLALMHLPTAVICAMVCLIYAALRVRKERRHGLGIAAATLIPLLGLAPVIARIAPEFAASFLQLAYLPEYLPYLPSPLYLWGYLPSIFFAIGVAFLVRRGEEQDHALILACLLLLIHNFIFFYFYHGVQILYHRSPLYLMLLMSILAGYALWRLRTLPVLTKAAVGFKARCFRLRWLRYALLGIIVAMILAESVNFHLNTRFYHMIDEEDYAAFIWIEENVSPDYQKAILDPWKATAFMALARREVYARIQHAPKEDDYQAIEFLDNGCIDTQFLEDNGISIVYTTGAVDNSDLVPLRENIYILP